MSERPGLNRIVVGVDGSAHSDAALRWAVDVATQTGAEIYAVYGIWGQFDKLAAYEVVPPAEFDADFRRELESEFREKWCAPLREAGVRYHAIIDYGRPATLINQLADKVDADLVVVGRRGRGGLAELLLGSTSHELTHTSRRPVVVISGLPGGGGQHDEQGAMEGTATAR